MTDTTAAANKPSSSVKLVLLGEAAVGKKCNLPHRTIKFEIWDTAGQERFASLAPMYYRNAQSALVVYDITKPTSLVKARHWVAELQRQASPGIVIALVGNKLDLSSSTDGETSSSSRNNITNTSSGSDGDGEGDASAPTETEDTAVDGDARKVSTEEGRGYAEEEGLLFFETSAKSGHNVQEVFTAIANAIPETQMKNTRGPGVAGAAQSALGAGTERVNLSGPRGEAGEKEG
ncbi:MAG: hypothetical protein L6R41_000724, partial [Letrouitia leprolyta]